MFNKLMSSLGLQGIQVDTRLHTTAPQAGQAIQGEVILKVPRLIKLSTVFI